MTSYERLERWADLLEQNPNRLLRPFDRLEYIRDARVRHAQRVGDSPLTVAFEDPVLRSEGLKSDSVGDAMKFFDLSDNTTHYILCYCHLGPEVTGGFVASRIRQFATRPRTRRAWTPWKTMAEVEFAPGAVACCVGALSVMLLVVALVWAAWARPTTYSITGNGPTWSG